MAVGTRMQQRRATAADWNTSNYVLQPGEIGVTTDTGIIKIGNGTSPWSELDIAFGSQYLPILGTAANSALLGGVSVNSLVKISDTDVNPTNNTYVKRTADGGVKASDATENTEVTTLQQQTAAITLAKQNLIARQLTANGTLALTDTGKSVTVNHASNTVQVTVTVPKNSVTAFPVGSWIDIVAVAEGAVKIIPVDGTVTLYGKVNVLPRYGAVRLTKINPDEWMGVELSKGGKAPRITAVRTGAGDAYGSAYAFVPYDQIDAAESFNPDNEWFSIPGTGLPTARRILINKDGEYTFNVAFGSTGTTGVTFLRLAQMTADNSATGMKIRAVQSINSVGVVSRTFRAFAGESYGVHHGFLTGSVGKADAQATGGDPSRFSITRVGD